MTNEKPPGTEDIPKTPELKSTGIDVGKKPLYETSGSHCNNGDCKLGKSVEETAWEQLWSGRVNNDQYDPPLPSGQGKTAPTPERYREVLAAVRPPAEHGIKGISQSWNAHVKTPMVTTTKPALTNAFEGLKGEWEGDDFTTFTERVTATHKFIDDILANLGGDTDSGKDTIITSLDNYATSLAEQQTGCRFPAAQVWSHEGGTSSEDRVHIRPPWHKGDCHEMGLAEAAEKLVDGMQGASSDYANMTTTWTSHFKTCATPQNHYWQYQAIQPKPGQNCDALPADKQLSDADAKKWAENYTTSIARIAKDQIYEDYEKNYRETADDIKTRTSNADENYKEDHPKLDTTTPPPPGLPGENPNTPPPGLGTPPPSSVPPPGGPPSAPIANPPGPIKTPGSPDMGDYKPYDPGKTTTPPPGHITNPPGTGTPPPYHGGFQGAGDGGFSKIGTPGGGGFGSPGSPGGGGWSPGGGGGGMGNPSGVGVLGNPAGAGRGMGAGAGAGAGAGKGLGAKGGGMGMMGGGAGAGGKGAAGAGGKGAGAGMLGGGRGGAHGNENEEHGTWLQEDDDVWGTDGDDAPPSLLR